MINKNHQQSKVIIIIYGRVLTDVEIKKLYELNRK